MRVKYCARITECEINAIVTQAFTSVTRLDKAKSEFQRTDIVPLISNSIYRDLDFLPSIVTDGSIQSVTEEKPQ